MCEKSSEFSVVQLLDQALDQISNVEEGDKFKLRDLFFGIYWNKLSIKNRRSLGHMFLAQVTSESKYNVVALGSDTSNQQVYQKISN